MRRPRVLRKQRGQDEGRDNQRAERDTVPAEYFEIVFFDEVHQELDGEHRHREGDRRADEQVAEFRARESAVFHEEFQELDRARARHYGYGEIERELRARGPRYADEQRADDGRARTGSAGDQGEDLEHADNKRVFVRNIRRRLQGQRFALVLVLHDDERHAVDDEHKRDDERGVQIRFQKIVEKYADHARGNAGYEYFSPKGKYIFIHNDLAFRGYLGRSVGAFRSFFAPREKLVPKKHDDGEDRAELNDDEEHFFELGAHVELKDLVQKEHVSRAGNGEPFGDAFDDTE